MHLAPIDWSPALIAGLSVAGVIVVVGIIALVVSLVRGSVRRPRELRPYRAYAARHRAAELVHGRVVRVDAGWACVVLDRLVVGFAWRPGAAPGDVIAVRLGEISARPVRIRLH